MRRIVALGSAKPPLLPSYEVKLDVLGGTDVIQPGDLIRFGPGEEDFHSWASISDQSVLMGKTLDAAMAEHHMSFIVARRAE
jgi:hypothetical protein